MDYFPSASKNLSLFPESFSSAEFDPFFYEDLARKSGYDLIAGVDEVGRGSLSGPVVAGAVIIPHGIKLAGIQDSKKMTEKTREEAFPVICRKAVTMGIGVVAHDYIDAFNILNASLEAMKRAVLALEPQPGILLVDGIYNINLPIPQKCLKKGDQISKSISAASVVAKVYRDNIMRSYHSMYPEYGFDKHKGYGTRMHFAALKKHGASPLHRITFKGVL